MSELLDNLAEVSKVRRVRTSRGAKKYGVPIGTPITRDVILRVGNPGKEPLRGSGKDTKHGGGRSQPGVAVDYDGKGQSTLAASKLRAGMKVKHSDGKVFTVGKIKETHNGVVIYDDKGARRMTRRPDHEVPLVDHKAAAPSMTTGKNGRLTTSTASPKVKEATADLKTKRREALTAKTIADIQRQKTPPVKCETVEKAVEELLKGNKVELPDKRQVSTLLSELKKVVDEADAKGEEKPTIDLCGVSVKGTNLFCVESKGIPRIKMPQLSGVPLPGSKAAELKADSRGEVNINDKFRHMLEGRGVKITDEDYPAANLKASQNELNGGKVAGIAQAIRDNHYDEVRLFVSSDDYIVDGHHRWAAKVTVDLDDGVEGDINMPIARVDMDILDLLIESNDFAEEWGIPQAGVGAFPKDVVKALAALLGKDCKTCG